MLQGRKGSGSEATLRPGNRYDDRASEREARHDCELMESSADTPQPPPPPSLCIPKYLLYIGTLTLVTVLYAQAQDQDLQYLYTKVGYFSYLSPP